MSQKSYVAIIVSLVLLLVLLVAKFVVSGKTEAGSAVDPRTVIVLDAAERAQILGEMRQFIVALQGVNDGLSRSDYQAAAAAARSMGKGSAKDVSIGLMGKLPLEFKKLGMSVHGDLDDLAADMETHKDLAPALRKVAAVMQKCAGCHAAYQIPNR